MQSDSQVEDEDEQWVEFDVLELEEAKQRKKDPRSFSRIICCGKCLVGPEDKNGNTYVANIVNFVMLGFNIVMISYTMKDEYIWLTSLSLFVGCLTQMFMWFVQCSDPGIINRNQDTDKLPFY